MQGEGLPPAPSSLSGEQVIMEMDKCKRRLTDREEEEEKVEEEGEQTGEGGSPSDAIGGVLERQACRKHLCGRERLQCPEAHLSDGEADQGTSDFSGLGVGQWKGKRRPRVLSRS